MPWFSPCPAEGLRAIPITYSCTYSKATGEDARRIKCNREHCFTERMSIRTNGAYPHFQLSLFLELLDPQQDLPSAFYQLNRTRSNMKHHSGNDVEML